MQSSTDVFHGPELVLEAQSLLGRAYGCVLPVVRDSNGALTVPLQRNAFGKWVGAARSNSEVEHLFNAFMPVGIALGIEPGSKFVAVRVQPGVDILSPHAFQERTETVSISEPSGSTVLLFQRDAAPRPTPPKPDDVEQVFDYVIMPPSPSHQYRDGLDPYRCRVLALAPFQLAH